HEVVDEQLGSSVEQFASDLSPSSVSKRYSFSTRTQGSSRRCSASSSPSLVCSFSRTNSPSRAASHSSRVPILWSVIFISLVIPWLPVPSVARLSSKAGGCAHGFEAEIRDTAEIHRSDRDTATGGAGVAHKSLLPKIARI